MENKEGMRADWRENFEWLIAKMELMNICTRYAHNSIDILCALGII